MPCFENIFFEGLKEAADKYNAEKLTKFTTWLNIILTRRVQSWLRINSLREECVRDESSITGRDGQSLCLQEMHDPQTENPSWLAECIERRERVKALVDALPDQNRQIVILHLIEKRTLDQTAQETGVSRSKCYWICHRFADELRRRFYDEE